MKSVYSAVRTGSLNKAVCASSVNGQYVAGNNKTHFGHYVKCAIATPDFNLMCVLMTDLHKIPQIEFQENVSFGSRYEVCGQTDRQTDRHAKAPSNPAVMIKLHAIL